MTFTRKVYAILGVQLAVAMDCIAVVLFVQAITSYPKDDLQLISALVMSIVLLIVLPFCSDLKRQWPSNIIMLGSFTLCEGVLLGILLSRYDGKEVLIAAGICTAVCLALTLFSTPIKWDFRLTGVILLALVVVLLIPGIVVIFVRGKIAQLIYFSLGALVFNAYVVSDTQRRRGGEPKHPISPDEYFAIVCIAYRIFCAQLKHSNKLKYSMSPDGPFAIVCITYLRFIAQLKRGGKLKYSISPDEYFAMVCIAYLGFGIQLKRCGKLKYSTSPKQYIAAALNLLFDIANACIRILAIVGGAKWSDDMPKFVLRKSNFPFMVNRSDLQPQ